jgi:hypothetical protein
MSEETTEPMTGVREREAFLGFELVAAMRGNSMRVWSMSCVLIHAQSCPTHLGKRIRRHP